jgi:GTP-binding protein SAR1
VIGNVRLRAWDLGGHEEVRHIWQEFYVQVDAIIFVVDSAEYERMQEAKRELQVLLEEPSLQNIPFLVLGNKSDLRAALKAEQLASALGLSPSVLVATSGREGGEQRPLRLFSCSLVEGHGYSAAFEVSLFCTKK